MRELGPCPAPEHPDPQHWRTLRAALARDRGCRLCGDTAGLEVHHRTYQRWGRERLADVTVVCRGCHDLITGAQMRRRDERRRPPPDGRAVVLVERYRLPAVVTLPDPVRGHQGVVVRPAPTAGEVLPPPARTGR